MARKRKTQRQPWTTEDDALLLENAGTLTARKMAQQLGRTPGSVQQKLYKLRKNGHGHQNGHEPPSENQMAQVAPEAERVASIMHFVERAIAHGWRVEIPDMGVTIN